MPKIVDSEEKRREILDAAVEAFSRHGYHGTNLQRVADAAGMGKSSLYHYFPTREALFDALVEELLAHEAAVFDEVVAARAPATRRLGALLDAVIGLFDSWTKTGPLLLDCLRSERGQRIFRKTLRRIRRSLAQLVRDGQAEKTFRRGDPEAMATVVIGCLDGVLFQEVLDPGSSRPEKLRDEMKAALESALLEDHR